MRQTCETVREGLLRDFMKRFHGVNCQYLSRAGYGTVNFELDMPSGEPRFEEVRKYCSDLEDSIAYPEIKILVKAIDPACEI